MVPSVASNSLFRLLLCPLDTPFSSPFLLSGRKTVSRSWYSLSASVPESVVSPGSPSAFEWKVTFRSKDLDTGCLIASEHPFSQALSLGRGRHVCMGNSHVQPRMSLFLPEPIEDVGSHDTSDSAPAPAGHPSLLPLHVYTFVPQQEEAGVCHSCLVNCSVALYPPDRPLAWLDCVPLTAPRNALCMRGSAPPTPPSMLGHPAAFPLGRKTPDLHPSPSSRPSSSLSE